MYINYSHSVDLCHLPICLFSCVFIYLVNTSLFELSKVYLDVALLCRMTKPYIPELRKIWKKYIPYPNESERGGPHGIGKVISEIWTERDKNHTPDNSLNLMKFTVKFLLHSLKWDFGLKINPTQTQAHNSKRIKYYIV